VAPAPTEISRNRWKSAEIGGNRQKLVEIGRNQQKSAEKRKVILHGPPKIQTKTFFCQFHLLGHECFANFVIRID
jgi:hypothetical protein